MRIEKAAKGGFYATLNSVRIHSSFDPEKEACRFISRAIEKEWNGETQINTVVLIGPGLGYLSKALLQLVDFQRIILFFLTEESRLFFEKELSWNDNRIICWDPSMGEEAALEVLSCIGELDLAGIKLLSWPPILQALPEEAERVQNLVVEYMRCLSGNIHTTGGFGKRWALNCFRNFLRISHYSPLPSLRHNASSVLIVASGRYLKEALPFIAENASQFIIVALPSALMALQEFKIKPDIIFSTDPGYYASLHYQSWNGDIPLAVPLTAYSSSLLNSKDLNSRNSDNKNERIVLFGQQSFFERAIEGRSQLSLPILPECGTVAGTALRWASENFSSPLLLAGLDFCFSDICSHVSPHPYESYLGRESKRSDPYLSTLYQRAFEQAPQTLLHEGSTIIRSGDSLNIYKEWTRRFLSSSAFLSKEKYRINPSPVDFGVPELSFENIKNIKDLSSHKIPLSFEERELPPLLERRDILKSIVKQWDRELIDLTPEYMGSSEINRSPFFYFEPAKLMQIRRDLAKKNLSNSSNTLVKEFKTVSGEFLKRLERVCG